ncbi:Cyclic di-GMP phosphodiesterase response regulator RpfG [Fundidesulfovibrio magnetotacticus]|uniref:Cyclic di-GMP phosphodiesterase response regulator RpfG n=1 Tax=Fundidesulfovibrio magnetotacticus TaxID=2730080 RepID=A0A6V8LRW0_9BACT|nr:HD domain-containing phosphohydrolase [Fundidesulfovibrio magnetotacticus]GFK92526.1 Cyclic di-GMP phosphodiesterase response regulator RpfG [Fundidesulfovibrio magnetotacticus]
MRKASIHRMLVARLLLVFVLLSAVVCAFDYYYELEKVDEHVLRLALEESSHFREDEVRYVRDGDLRRLEAGAREHLMTSAFMIIEFYDANRKPLVEVTKPEAASIEEQFNRLAHQDLLGDAPRYRKLEHQGRLYLRVAAPLAVDGSVAGYFEGIYAVGEAEFARIREQMAFSLLKVVAVVFVTTLALYPVILALNRRVLDYAGVLLEANIGALESLGNAVAKRDSDTSEHNYRVTLQAIALAERLGLDRPTLQELVKGAFLHDVGKIAISDAILLKPGRLTEEEFAVMRTHVAHGVDILSDYQWLKEAVHVVEFHHEKFDGSGYVRGLKGRDIPETARIFCIVDVFDALTSRRPYKEPFSCETALAILREGSGTHFDPDCLEAFLAIAPELHEAQRTMDERTLRTLLRARVRALFG